MSASSISGGAYNKFIDQRIRPESGGSENDSVRPATDFQTRLEPELAARLAELARSATAISSDVSVRSQLAAPAAPVSRPDFATRTTAEVTRLTPRVNNQQAVAPHAPAPIPVAGEADAVAGQKFLDELESWLMQIEPVARSRPASPSTPKSKPSR